MPKALIAYYSRTGHTESMAMAIAEGMRSVKGVEVIVKRVEDVTNRVLLEAHAIVLGSPTYFRLPAWPVKKLIDESIDIYGLLRGKIGGIFTSTGGRHGGLICLKALKDMLEEHGIEVIDEGVMAIERPNEEELQKCREYGVKIAKRLLRT